MTTPNAELAYRVLDHIDTHPEQHDQHVWIEQTSTCGTAACFAGWTCLIAGDDPLFDEDDPETHEVLAEGSILPVGGRAAALLGIPYDRAVPAGNILFDQHNTREDLGRLVAEIFGPRPGGAA